AALASWLGRSVQLRRDDIRTLVGCGAAGAIAAAFNAPLTGAFYAFELIIGSYTLQSLAPVGLAALTGDLVVRGLVGSNPIFVVSHEIAISVFDYAAFFGVGLASAGLGILVMKGVTSTETLFRSLAVPRWADPLIYTLVGMGSVAAAIVGAPMTMIMIVLETTGDFPATIGVMLGVVTAAIAVRHWFGYSFATWRFHLRGLAIQSPEDIGW